MYQKNYEASGDSVWNECVSTVCKTASIYYIYEFNPEKYVLTEESKKSFHPLN